MEERERGLTGTNIVTVGDVCQRAHGAWCCMAFFLALAGRVTIWPECQKMFKIFKESNGRSERGEEGKLEESVQSSI